MAFFLGGMTLIGAGWLGPRAVYVDFVSTNTADVYQLYAGKTRIGTTLRPSERRIVGQLFQDEAPATLTLVRVDKANRLTDYGDQIPYVPWHQYELQWTAAAMAADTDHFEITASSAAGEAVDSANILAKLPYIGDGAYQFVLPPIAETGSWIYRITPRDNAQPDGNAGTASNVTVNAVVPPPDFEQDSDGNRFTLAVAAGELVVGFTYGVIA